LDWEARAAKGERVLVKVLVDKDNPHRSETGDELTVKIQAGTPLEDVEHSALCDRSSRFVGFRQEKFLKAVEDATKSEGITLQSTLIRREVDFLRAQAVHQTTQNREYWVVDEGAKIPRKLPGYELVTKRVPLTYRVQGRLVRSRPLLTYPIRRSKFARYFALKDQFKKARTQEILDWCSSFNAQPHALREQAIADHDLAKVRIPKLRMMQETADDKKFMDLDRQLNALMRMELDYQVTIDRAAHTVSLR